tara:strand:- start:926 stop:1852 length:927 start_codon:yes stop_codon:yes gene_type:complete
MKVHKVKDKRAVIKVPPNSRVPIETSPNMFKHHVLMLVCGKRGAGKSVFINNYLRMLKEEKKADRILVVSPTATSNEALLRSLNVDMEDVFDPDDPNVIKHLTNIIDEERDTYVEELQKIKRFNHFQKLTQDKGIPIMNLDPYAFIEFSDEMGNLVKPTTRYGHRPCIHVFMDDCQSSAVFRDKKFLNFAIRHRHIGGIKMDKSHKELSGALGCSLYVAIQNLKAQGGGCPRAIRNNATQLIIVGKSKDEQELKDIYSSVGGEIDYEPFMKGYEYATKEPHNSFVIDLHPKKEHPSRFRKNMNEFIVI